jgi:UDPglucose 6-dehydrogenase
MPEIKKHRRTEMRVSIAGTGYVGLVSGVCLAHYGHDVTCIDIDAAKVAAINNGKSPIYEPGLDELMAENVGVRLRATTDLREAVMNSDITLIAVGTPFDGEHIDLRFVETVASQIGEVLKDKDTYHCVVVKSTVVPGTTEGVVRKALEQASGKVAGPDFGLGMNPEFLKEGEAIQDFMEPDRIVLGGIDDRSIDSLGMLYEPFKGVDIIRTRPSTAEMIKYTANSLLATMISFSNEIANLCDAVGVDVVDAVVGVHLDKRLSPIIDGQRITPSFTTYLWPGCGFGGSCFPKDVKALVAYGDDNGSPMHLLRSVVEVNADQPRRMIDLLRRHYADLNGLNVTVLGVAFKPGTDDIRESPGIAIVQQLCAMGANVTVHDPVAAESASKELPDGVRFVDDIERSIDGSSAVLLTTRWPEYNQLAKIVSKLDAQPLVIDGRRMLNPTDFARFEAIGLRSSK